MEMKAIVVVKIWSVSMPHAKNPLQNFSERFNMELQ
jgi:hypothetical protein